VSSTQSTDGTTQEEAQELPLARNLFPPNPFPEPASHIEVEPKEVIGQEEYAQLALDMSEGVPFWSLPDAKATAFRILTSKNTVESITVLVLDSFLSKVREWMRFRDWKQTNHVANAYRKYQDSAYYKSFNARGGSRMVETMWHWAIILVPLGDVLRDPIHRSAHWFWGAKVPNIALEGYSEATALLATVQMVFQMAGDNTATLLDDRMVLAVQNNGAYANALEIVSRMARGLPTTFGGRIKQLFGLRTKRTIIGQPF
jgi:hypothetical protein